MADKEDLYTVNENTGKTKNGLIIEYTGSNEQIKQSAGNQAAIKASKVIEDESKSPLPKFTLSDGKVSVTGGEDKLSHPVVTEMKKALSNAFKGKDLTDKDVAAAFQKAITKANEQIDAQFKYEDYEDFLKSSGFSDDAYRSYSTARQEFKKTNPTSSTAMVTTYDKSGKLVSKSISEWFDYWKKEYSPEDRGQLWVKSLQASYNPTSDEDLYASIPAILMGAKKGQNVVQGFFQWINPFDDADGVESARTVTPVYGFDDTNPISVGIQSAVAEFGRILPQFLGAGNNPWLDRGAEDGGDFFGINDWKDEYLENWSREDFQEWAKLAHEAAENEGANTYEKMKELYGDTNGRKMWMAYTLSLKGQEGVGGGKVLDTIKEGDKVVAEAGDYVGYQNYRNLWRELNSQTPAKSWDQNLQNSIEKFATYAPNAASVGVVAGQVGRIIAEQAALSLISGGALSASNIAKTLTRGGWKLVGKATGIIKTGQEIAKTSPALARAIYGLAHGSSQGLTGASRILYRLGQAGTWAVREVGEDALRGIVDDAVTRNSFDSQGNLDLSRFMENVYMNAVMGAILKGPRTISDITMHLLNADRNIDGLKLTGTQVSQMQDLAQAASGTADSVIKSIDEDGHPTITKGGVDQKLDQVTLTKENADKALPEQAPTKTLEEAVFEDESIAKKTQGAPGEVSIADEEVKEVISGQDPEAAKNLIERKLTDDEIRRKFKNGKVSINGEDYIIDVKNANLDDIVSANGSTIKDLNTGVARLVASVKQGLRSYQEAVNGIKSHADEFATNWKNAVEKFASDNNISVRDVIIALRDLRIDGTEPYPGLKALWEENWAPTANGLLDAQDSLTKIRTKRQNYYQRDMFAGVFKPGENGNYAIDQGTIDDILGRDTTFDLTASSRKGNRQKVNDADLETDPEILAKEFVLSRLETIERYSDQGKIIATMREAISDGEELTQKEAAESLRASKKIGNDIRNSEEVQAVGKTVTEQTPIDNVEELADGFGKEDMTKLDEDIKAQKKVVSDLEAEVTKANKELDDEINSQEKADVSWYNSTHPVEDGKIDDPSQRVIPKISEAEEDIRGANRPDGYGTPEYFNKSSDDYTEEDWKYSARENLKRYEELVAQRNELEKNGWKDDIGRNFTEREAIVDKDGNVVGYGASGAENLDLNISTAYNNYQNALSRFRGGEEPITAIADTPAVVDGHEYRTKNVSDGYAKFIKDNLSDRRSNMEPVDKAANIALEQRIITPGGLADELNPGLRKGKKISPEAIVDGLDVKRLADNYYIGNASDVAEWPVWDNSNLFKLSNELLGTKFEDGVDYGYEAAKEAENAIKEKLKEAIPRALENFGNKKLDNDVTLYRVVSEGNKVNKGNIGFLKKDSGEFKNSGISYLTLDEDAVLSHPNLTGSGKKYILRIKMPKGDSISAFDRSVLTQNYGDFGEEALASSGHRAGGEFAANLDGYKFKHTGEFNKDGIEILDVYKESENADSDGQTTDIDGYINYYETEIPKNLVAEGMADESKAHYFTEENPEVLYENNVKTPEQENAVKTYSGFGYGVNEYLRKGRPVDYYGTPAEAEKAEKFIEQLDSTMKGKLNKNTITYRAVNGKHSVGDVIDNKGYTSTALNPENISDAAGDTVVRLKVNRGTNALYIGEDTGNNMNESELLFPRDAKIRITKDYSGLTEEQRYDLGLPDKVKYDGELIVGGREAGDSTINAKLNAKLAAEKQKLADLEKRKAAAEKIEKAGDPNTEAGQKAREKATVDVVADTAKNTAEKAQDNFNKAADKSNAAREISESSKYRNRASAQANQNPIGVNYMPGNPFRGFGRWINDDFMRSQSVQINVNGKVYSAYSGGYSLFKEAPSWARMAIIDIRNGATLETAIRNVLSQNGVKIEPTDYARKKYNAPTSMEKDAEKASRIAKKITESALYSKAVKNGIVVDTELLGSMLTKELRRQGAAEFTRFLKKSKFDSFSNPQQKWLNSQAYKMIASFDPKTYKGIKANIRKAMGIVMGAKYRSNMYGNFKNAQLQLTECQRLYTLNKLGDFNKTIRRLVTDQAFRDKIADAAYIYASDSLGQGLSKQDLSLFNQTLESFMKTADASTITAKGILTKLSEGAKKGTKAAIDGVDADLLSATQAAEYFKNYMLLAGIVQSAETKGLTGDAANAYIRNRFNVEALAGTEIGHIGLTESSIGRLAFMYMGFPIRELALQAHIIKGGGITGGTTKLDKVAGGLLYAEKMLGTKGLVWALEAPWGYKFADVMGYDPFGVTDDRDRTADNKNVDPWMRGADIAVQYMPFMRGAISSAFVDIYMAYRESYEDAKDEWLETHDSLEGFEWHLDDAPQDTIWQDALKGFTPGYTAFSRAAQEAGDLDRGYGISSTGNRMYETNTDPGSVAWGMLVGRSNTPNAQDYYQTANPIRDVQRYGLPGLGRSVERALPFRLNRSEGAQMGWRNFREFDPIDANSYSDWFDGSYADEQNWNTGYYAFREEAEEIRDAANAGLTQSNAVEKLASRESQLADLRNRVERYVQAYIAKHPEGISNYKMQQIQRIFNMEVPDAGTSFDRVLGDYSDYEKNYAENRVAQGNFPAPYGLNTPYRTQDGTVAGDYSYAQSPQLRNILQTNQYGVQSDVGRVIAQLDDQLVATPYGSMSLKDFRKKIQADINNEYAQSKVNYDKISDLQGQYLDVFDRSIRPIFSTYGSGILNAGQASDVMQQFTSMLNGLIPSEEYRVDKKGRKIRQSTPYMRVDIKKWLQKNYGNYPAVSTTDNSSEDRLRGIRNDMDAGRTAVARAKALAFVEDLREGRTSIDRTRLEELQNILRGTTGSGVTGGGNLNTGLTR